MPLAPRPGVAPAASVCAPAPWPLGAHLHEVSFPDRTAYRARVTSARGTLVRSAAVAALGAALAGGCRGKVAPTSDARVDSAAVDSSPPDADQAASVSLPPDLDVKRLEQELGCARGRHARVCKIVREFDEGSKYTGQLPSGGARWMGHGYRVEKAGPEKADLVVLSAVGMPTGTGGGADLPFRMGLDPLPKDLHKDGRKLADALARSASVPKSNKALPFVRAYTSDNSRIAFATSGMSVRLLSEDAVFVRQGKVRQELLVIRLKASASGMPLGEGDGDYAHLWPVTW